MPKSMEWIGDVPHPKLATKQPEPQHLPQVLPTIPDEPVELTYKFKGRINGREVETITLSNIQGIKKGYIVVVALNPVTKEQLVTMTVPSLQKDEL